MPWLGIPASLIAAYLAVKAEGSAPWMWLSTSLWTVIALVILGCLALVPALLIVGLKGL